MQKEFAMKRLAVLAIALVLAPAALAQLYKWVDKDGRVTYSDQPPPAQQSKQLNISTGVTGPGAASAPRPAGEAEKDAQKAKTAAAEKAQKDEEAARAKKQNEEYCARARAYLKTVTDGGRIATYDANGERILMDDQQLEAERMRAQKEVDESCKAS
jgi:hypothetical protein